MTDAELVTQQYLWMLISPESFSNLGRRGKINTLKTRWSFDTQGHRVTNRFDLYFRLVDGGFDYENMKLTPGRPEHRSSLQKFKKRGTY